eukprot:105602-Pelagomonas_calceolata.AAC.5
MDAVASPLLLRRFSLICSWEVSIPRTYHCAQRLSAWQEGIRNLALSNKVGQAFRYDGIDGLTCALLQPQELCQATLRAALVECLLHDKDTGEPYMDSVVTLLLDIVEGMEHIHSKNIIHGDLKPENVLLSADPSSPVQMVAKITGKEEQRKSKKGNRTSAVTEQALPNFPNTYNMRALFGMYRGQARGSIEGQWSWCVAL